jgi:hypothetical protein
MYWAARGRSLVLGYTSSEVKLWSRRLCVEEVNQPCESRGAGCLGEKSWLLSNGVRLNRSYYYYNSGIRRCGAIVNHESQTPFMRCKFKESVPALTSSVGSPKAICYLSSGRVSAIARTVQARSMFGRRGSPKALPSTSFMCINLHERLLVRRRRPGFRRD